MYRRHIEKLARTRLDDVLLDEGLIDRGHVEDAQAETEMTGRQLSQILFERDVLDEWDLAKIVSRHYSLPFVDLATYTVPRESDDILPADFCAEHLVVPFDTFGAAFTMAVCQMPSPALLDEIATLTGRTPFIYVALRKMIVEIVQARVAASPAVAPTNARRSVPAHASVEAAPATTPPPRTPAARPRSDLPPVSMRLGFSMSARVAGKSPAQRPVAVSARPTPAKKKQGGGWESIFDVGDDAVSG